MRKSQTRLSHVLYRRDPLSRCILVNQLMVHDSGGCDQSWLNHINGNLVIDHL